ncbi:MAG: glutamate racemase [Clostridia bacterium]|nr:glutamate racemase [Clostridia bacterium]
MGDRRAIGVFDSGLGGLTVVKELSVFLPDENIVYFGDTGRVPYGTRSRETIRKYAAQDERFLLTHNVKTIIAACGTVSSVASDTAKDLPVPFFEVVSHAAKEAVATTRNKKIGVIGTAATIKSGQHERFIKSIMPEAEVIACSCSMFVPLVEEGWYNADDIVVLETVRRYLEPIINAKVDTLILGCTHYPVLSDAIRRVVGEDVTLINAGIATAKAVKEYLNQNKMLNDSGVVGINEFYVSDKPDSFRRIASVLLNDNIDEGKVEQVNISSL